eukprot:15484676-Alexandrium_andersonii.AAC.1
MVLEVPGGSAVELAAADVGPTPGLAQLVVVVVARARGGRAGTSRGACGQGGGELAATVVVAAEPELAAQGRRVG